LIGILTLITVLGITTQSALTNNKKMRIQNRRMLTGVGSTCLELINGAAFNFLGLSNSNDYQIDLLSVPGGLSGTLSFDICKMINTDHQCDKSKKTYAV